MTTKHSKDHWRTTASGKVIYVHGHDYEVAQDFHAIFGGAKPEVEPEPEPGAAAEPEDDQTLHDDFAAVFGPTPGLQAPQAAQAPQERGGPHKGILAWKGDQTPNLLYGDVPVTFGKYGLKPTARIKVDKAKGQGIISDLKELGIQARWMPQGKCVMVWLHGMPQAGGKKTSEALHGYLKGAFGPPQAGTPSQAPSPAPPTAPATASSKAATGPVPTSIAGWKKIGGQMGSNEGALYQDALGKKWYVKFPPTEDHAKNEVLASKLYKFAGVAVPNLRIVTLGGKVGVASAWKEGLKKDAKALPKAPGAQGGFGADAWLANWDVCGLGNDNLLLDPDGSAVRIDVGGALLFRAQGGPKGEAFSATVNEIHTLNNPATNPNTAALFKGMTSDQVETSVAQVLEIPDSAIQAAVEKWGPGGAKEKQDLAAKLVARKAYLAKVYPGADLLANPPKPDPTKLPVDESKLPKPPDFLNWNGQGKGLSSSEAVNQANQRDVNAVLKFAMKGNLIALQDYKYEAVDKSTGASLGMKPINEHPSQHVQAYWADCVAFMEVIANPSAKKAKAWVAEDVTDYDSLSEAFPNRPPGTTVAQIPADERLGWWMTLGTVESTLDLTPKQTHDVTAKERAAVNQAYTTIPSELKTWLGHVQVSGSSNFGNKGLTPEQRKIVKLAYKHAVEFPEGTMLRRWLALEPTMLPLMEKAPIGLLFENPRSTCASMSSSWGDSPKFGGHNKTGCLMEMVYAKGAKGLPTAGSGSYASEQEITTLPGQRYMLLSKGKHSSGKPVYRVLVLPPDPTYIEALQ